MKVYLLSIWTLRIKNQQGKVTSLRLCLTLTLPVQPWLSDWLSLFIVHVKQVTVGLPTPLW